MSTNVGRIHYDLDLETQSFDKAVQGVKAKTDSLGSNMQKMGKKMQHMGKTMTVGLSLPIAVGAGIAIKRASDLQETLNKVDVAFKKDAQSVKDWSKTTIEQFGMAGSTAMESASLFGDMGTAMGLNTGEAADMSMSLTALAGDLASFKNVSADMASTALKGIFTGEGEALKNLGVVMQESTLEAYALSKGMGKTYREMSQAEKVQLRYAYVMEMTKNAQGDFARTSDGTANQIRVTQERFKELSEQLGEKLLPIVNKILEKVQVWIDKFSNLSPKTQNMILIFLGVVAVLGPLLIILGSLASAIAAIGTVMAMITVPIAIVIAVLAVLAVLAFLIIKNWDKLKLWFTQFWNRIKVGFQDLVNFVKTMWETFRNWFNAFWQSIKRSITEFFSNAVNWLKERGRAIVQGLINGIKTMGSGVWNGIKSVADKIGGFFGGAGAWLYNTGRAIIQGLIDGFVSMFNSVRNTLGDLTNKLTQWKGPMSKDKILLEQSGQVVMSGFIRGLESMYGQTRQTLGGLTNSLASGVVNNSTTSIGTINIQDRPTADYFLNRIDRNQQLTALGLSTRQ